MRNARTGQDFHLHERAPPAHILFRESSIDLKTTQRQLALTWIGNKKLTTDNLHSLCMKTSTLSTNNLQYRLFPSMCFGCVLVATTPAACCELQAASRIILKITDSILQCSGLHGSHEKLVRGPRLCDSHRHQAINISPSCRMDVSRRCLFAKSCDMC
jgi:hypothetical protein